MAREIEAKYRVGSLAPLRRALGRLGGRWLFSAVQTDRYLDTPGRDLLAGDRGVRLRTLSRVRCGEGACDRRALLTYKGPRSAGAVKSRAEHQMYVDDPAVLVQLLGALGLSSTLTIQKRRSSFRLGRCLVELDELPLIGRFVEIEGPSAGAVRAVAKKLGLAGEPVQSHYVHLLLEACRRAGQKCDEITFGRCGARGPRKSASRRK